MHAEDPETTPKRLCALEIGTAEKQNSGTGRVHSVPQHLKVKPELFPEENKPVISYCLKGPEDLK